MQNWLQDLVQRLESITIHWTRQIKEVVNQQVGSGNISLMMQRHALQGFESPSTA